MKFRVALTIIVLFLYGVAFNFYIVKLTTWGYDRAVLLYNWTTLLMLVFCLWDFKNGFVNDFHRQLNYVGFLCLIVNYIFILLTHYKVLNDPVWMFLAFNSGVGLITISVFINAIHTKIFLD